jgi:hypothetical protein
MAAYLNSLLRLFMEITNRLGLPAGIVKAASTERHNAPMCLSATTLIQGLKQILLTERHWDELTDDVADRIWAIWGTAVHSLLVHEGENDFTEQEMSYELGGITITGQIDNYDMANGIIVDYKTAGVNKVMFNTVYFKILFAPTYNRPCTAILRIAVQGRGKNVFE